MIPAPGQLQGEFFNWGPPQNHKFQKKIESPTGAPSKSQVQKEKKIESPTGAPSKSQVRNKIESPTGAPSKS